MNFNTLNLNENIMKAIAEAGYKQATPIQMQAIPPVLEGRDVLGCAQTGTGKTAAFAIPILQRLDKSQKTKSIKALILTPTRELALQIFESFEKYGKYTGYKSAVIFGGVAQGPQINKVKAGVDILIATPGRLMDLIGQKHISLKEIEFFVLDEADRMLDMGFITDVKRIIHMLPSKRQTLLFSATMPKEIKHLADGLLTNPEHIAVTPVSTTAESIEQSVYMVDRHNKRALLTHIIKERGMEQTLVFTRTKHGADRVARELKKHDITADAIHGDKSQGARQRALGNFKNGEICVLVATDIAARGIDISGLPCVINFDLPEIPETYVHRIGRTGRAGRTGIAISLCDGAQTSYLIDIEELTGVRIEEVEDHKYPMTGEAPPTPQVNNNAKNAQNKNANQAKLKQAAKKIEETKAPVVQEAVAEKKPRNTANRRRKPANNTEKNTTQPQVQESAQKTQEKQTKPNNRQTVKPKQKQVVKPQQKQEVNQIEKQEQNKTQKPKQQTNKPVKPQPKQAVKQSVNTPQKQATKENVKNIQKNQKNVEQKAGNNVKPNGRPMQNRGGGRRLIDNDRAQAETKPLPARELPESLKARIAAKVAEVLSKKNQTDVETTTEQKPKQQRTKRPQRRQKQQENIKD